MWFSTPRHRQGSLCVYIRQRTTNDKSCRKDSKFSRHIKTEGHFPLVLVLFPFAPLAAERERQAVRPAEHPNPNN